MPHSHQEGKTEKPLKQSIITLVQMACCHLRQVTQPSYAWISLKHPEMIRVTDTHRARRQGAPAMKEEHGHVIVWTWAFPDSRKSVLGKWRERKTTPATSRKWDTQQELHSDERMGSLAKGDLGPVSGWPDQEGPIFKPTMTSEWFLNQGFCCRSKGTNAVNSRSGPTVGGFSAENTRIGVEIIWV